MSELYKYLHKNVSNDFKKELEKLYQEYNMVNTGCDYEFKRGVKKGSKCGKTVKKGGSKCSLHSQSKKTLVDNNETNRTANKIKPVVFEKIGKYHTISGTNLVVKDINTPIIIGKLVENKLVRNLNESDLVIASKYKSIEIEDILIVTRSDEENPYSCFPDSDDEDSDDEN